MFRAAGDGTVTTYGLNFTVIQKSVFYERYSHNGPSGKLGGGVKLVGGIK